MFIRHLVRLNFITSKLPKKSQDIVTLHQNIFTTFLLRHAEILFLHPKIFKSTTWLSFPGRRLHHLFSFLLRLFLSFFFLYFFLHFCGVFVYTYSDLSGGSATMASSLLLAVVVVLDMVAFALAVAAKQRRNTVSHSLLLFLSWPVFFLVFLFLRLCLWSYDFFLYFFSMDLI